MARTVAAAQRLSVIAALYLRKMKAITLSIICMFLSACSTVSPIKIEFRQKTEVDNNFTLNSGMYIGVFTHDDNPVQLSKDQIAKIIKALNNKGYNNVNFYNPKTDSPPEKMDVVLLVGVSQTERVDFKVKVKGQKDDFRLAGFFMTFSDVPTQEKTLYSSTITDSEACSNKDIYDILISEGLKNLNFKEQFDFKYFVDVTNHSSCKKKV